MTAPLRIFRPARVKTAREPQKLLRPGSSGFSLIEVIITMAMLTIGLTGLAAMQMSSRQLVHSSHFLSLATTIAMDFEERMWVELADNDLEGCPDTSALEGSPASELARHWSRIAAGEEWGWSDANMLTIPDLSITPGTPIVGTSVVQFPITLSWTEARFGDAEKSTASFTYNVRIQCRAA